MAGWVGELRVGGPSATRYALPDGARGTGLIEEVLVGTPVADPAQPVEVLRVIHSFDPCLACAVHVTRDGEGKRARERADGRRAS